KAVFVGDVSINVVISGEHRRQRNFEFRPASLHRVQMGESILLFVANHEEMYQFAMVRNERRPSTAASRSVDLDGQNGLVAFDTHLGGHRKDRKSTRLNSSHT